MTTPNLIYSYLVIIIPQILAIKSRGACLFLAVSSYYLSVNTKFILILHLT
jgi:hypothetical protein